MARRREVERAKKRFLRETRDREWLQAIGIGKVQERLGLVISVRPGAKSAASRIVNRLELDVPVTLRAVKEIRARLSSEGHAKRETESIAVLRKAALERFNRPID